MWTAVTGGDSWASKRCTPHPPNTAVGVWRLGAGQEPFREPTHCPCFSSLTLLKGYLGSIPTHKCNLDLVGFFFFFSFKFTCFPPEFWNWRGNCPKETKVFILHQLFPFQFGTTIWNNHPSQLTFTELRGMETQTRGLLKEPFFRRTLALPTPANWLII